MRHDIATAITEHQVVVVAGETGSGKTTQLPKICLELGRGIRGTIGHTQPRRLAARTVGQRIADELHVPLGDAVGYTVRFNDHASDRTLVKLMTDGILLAEIQRDRRLLRYDTLILDEAHERSLNIDFLLGYLRELLPRRPDLKVIVTSATIEPGRFAAHFGGAPDRRGVRPHLSRSRSVTAHWKSSTAIRRRRGPRRPGPRRHPHRGARSDRGHHRRRPRTRGRAARATCWSSCPASARSATPAKPCAASSARHTEVLPLYARLPTAEQQKVFAPSHSAPPSRVGHQRRRDVADGAGHPLRRRPRHRAHLAVQPTDQGAAAADRAHLAGVGRPACGPVGSDRTGRVHPAVLRGRLRIPAPLHRSRDPADQPRGGDPADDGARSR